MTTKLGESIRSDTENEMDTTIKPTIIHHKQETGTGHSDWNHFKIRILNSGIDVTISRRNIDNHTEMKPQGTIMTTFPESNRANNCDIFYLASKTSDLAYRDSPWHGTMKELNWKDSEKPYRQHNFQKY